MFEFNKKGAGQAPEQATGPVRQPTAPPPPSDTRPVAPPSPTPAPQAAVTTARRSTAVIGPSIQIDGNLRGAEDLYIEGEVSGTIHLESNSLTIGSQGKVKANVFAHTVYVDGWMEGDLYGAEQVIVRRNAQVRGNITSPRVTLEDGASFKGSIEMDAEAVKSAIGPAATRSVGSTPPQPAAASPASRPAIAAAQATAQNR